MKAAAEKAYAARRPERYRRIGSHMDQAAKKT